MNTQSSNSNFKKSKNMNATLFNYGIKIKSSETSNKKKDMQEKYAHIQSNIPTFNNKNGNALDILMKNRQEVNANTSAQIDKAKSINCICFELNFNHHLRFYDTDIYSIEQSEILKYEKQAIKENVEEEYTTIVNIRQLPTILFNLPIFQCIFGPNMDNEAVLPIKNKQLKCLLKTNILSDSNTKSLLTTAPDNSQMNNSYDNLVNREASASTPTSTSSSNSPYRFSQEISILKSMLQKAIRRGKSSCALQLGKQLFLYSPMEFLRRLSIIILEDALYHVHYPVLVFCMIVNTKGYILNKQLQSVLFQLLMDITSSTLRDIPPSIEGLLDRKELHNIQYMIDFCFLRLERLFFSKGVDADVVADKRPIKDNINTQTDGYSRMFQRIFTMYRLHRQHMIADDKKTPAADEEPCVIGKELNVHEILSGFMILLQLSDKLHTKAKMDAIPESCEVGNHTTIPQIISTNYFTITQCQVLGVLSFIRTVVTSIYFRSCYGGMKGDIAMCHRFGDAWLFRFLCGFVGFLQHCSVDVEPPESLELRPNVTGEYSTIAMLSYNWDEIRYAWSEESLGDSSHSIFNAQTTTRDIYFPRFNHSDLKTCGPYLYTNAQNMQLIMHSNYSSDTVGASLMNKNVERKQENVQNSIFEQSIEASDMLPEGIDPHCDVHLCSYVIEQLLLHLKCDICQLYDWFHYENEQQRSMPYKQYLYEKGIQNQEKQELFHAENALKHADLDGMKSEIEKKISECIWYYRSCINNRPMMIRTDMSKDIRTSFEYKQEEIQFKSKNLHYWSVICPILQVYVQKKVKSIWCKIQLYNRRHRDEGSEDMIQTKKRKLLNNTF